MPKFLISKSEFLEKQLVVKSSGIPGAGKGLFTTIAIEKETVITEFSGEKISHTIGAARSIMNESHSLLYLNQKYFVDSYADKSCMATFINDAIGEVRINGIDNNTTIHRANGRIYVIALRDIQAGEELFLEYGPDYWNRRSIKK